MNEQNTNSGNGAESLTAFAHEITYQRYLMTKGSIRHLFSDISLPDYIALHYIASGRDADSIYSDRIYLNEISEKMELTMRQTSRMIRSMKERGIVNWQHDGDGQEGTYVTITDHGKQLLQKTEDVLKHYYEQVLDKFGRKRMIQMLHLMKELETVMKTTLEEMEDSDGTDTSDD